MRIAVYAPNLSCYNQSIMNRRQFIGGLVAASSLPILSKDNPSVFHERGTWERLALNYIHINIGALKPFSVLHISDTHLTSANPDEPAVKQTLCESRTRCFGGRQEEALRDSLAWARDNADYVIHTGDLIDWQSNANFDIVKKCFGEKVIGSMGNHEFSPSMWLSDPKETNDEANKLRSRDLLASVYPFNLSFQSTIIHGVNFVTLDDSYGSVTEEQVACFKKELEKGYPIILCMHVPFMSPEIWRARHKYWMGAKWNRTSMKFTSAEVPAPDDEYKIQLEDPVTRGFIAYLKTEKLLRGILTGHLHFTMQDRFSPTANQYIVGGNFMFLGQEVLFT